MQNESTKLIFVINFSVLDFFKFASRMSQITQILVSTFKIFWRGGGGMPPDLPRNVHFFFSLAIPGSEITTIAVLAEMCFCSFYFLYTYYCCCCYCHCSLCCYHYYCVGFLCAVQFSIGTPPKTGSWKRTSSLSSSPTVTQLEGATAVAVTVGSPIPRSGQCWCLPCCVCCHGELYEICVRVCV